MPLTPRSLKALVGGPRAALRRYPGDLARVGFLDVARLAMHAIGGIDLKLLAAASVRDHFVDVCGTKIGAGIAGICQAPRRAEGGISYMQRPALVLIVCRRGEECEGRAISRRQFPIT